MIKKNGKRKDNYNSEKTSEVLAKSKALLRRDNGGGVANKVLSDRLKKAGGTGPFTSSDLDAIQEVLKQNNEGNKSRMFPRIDEAIKRCKKKGD